MSAGEAHSLALTSKREVFAWGRGDSGQLGLAEGLSIAAPTRVEGLSFIVSIAGGALCSLVLDSNNHLIFWGTLPADESSGFPGLSSALPLLFDGVDLPNFVAIAAGRAHLLALSPDGVVWAPTGGWWRGSPM